MSDETLRWTPEDGDRLTYDRELTDLYTLIFQERMPDVLQTNTMSRIYDYNRIAFQLGFNKGFELGYTQRENELLDDMAYWAIHDAEEELTEPEQKEAPPEISPKQRLRWFPNIFRF